ncbi:MAG: hypothetical protein N4A45_07690 [Flavobacteriales bacterium]|jgi:hypothetical protein|nr:hypothetical protein [Flavobacteriales bacterium]
MKYLIRLVLLAVVGYLAVQLYNSIQEPIIFEKKKEAIYTEVKERLHLIKDAQMAFKEGNKRYANNFSELINHIDTAEFVLISKRDSSFLYYNKVYREKQEKIVTIVDTLGFVSIKDSVFNNDDNLLKNLASIPTSKKGDKFEMKTSLVKKGSLNVPTLLVKAKKEVLLEGLNKRLIANKADDLTIGSLEEVHLNGNW